MEYDLIACKGITEFVALVNDAIASGWKTVGGIAVTQEAGTLEKGYVHIMYYQAVERNQLQETT